MTDTPVELSILDSVKKVLNLEPEYDSFDVDIIMHINSVFSSLSELGIGPIEGFEIAGQATAWSTFLEDKKWLNQVKSYMYLRVRLLFDPPTTSFALDSFQKQIDKYEFYLSLYAPPANPVV